MKLSDYNLASCECENSACRIDTAVYFGRILKQVVMAFLL